MFIRLDTANIKSVTFHPYRTTRAWPIVLSANYDRGDDIDGIQQSLAQQSGKRPDNHTVYEVEYYDGNKVCFWFSDWKMMVCLKVDNKRW